MMHDQRLDSLAKSFAVSRRTGARTLLGALLTMQVVTSAQPADARKRRRRGVSCGDDRCARGEVCEYVEPFGDRCVCKITGDPACNGECCSPGELCTDLGCQGILGYDPNDANTCVAEGLSCMVPCGYLGNPKFCADSTACCAGLRCVGESAYYYTRWRCRV